MNDHYNLNRFIVAQSNSYKNALNEIRSGRKKSHWIWYIFPQYAGLGKSSISIKYSITSKAEAIEYMQHPLRLM
jgi:uncharacterized protein (DUF1810 family)